MLLKDGRSNVSARNNQSLRYAAMKGHLSVVNRLLQENDVLDVHHGEELKTTDGTYMHIYTKIYIYNNSNNNIIL